MYVGVLLVSMIYCILNTYSSFTCTLAVKSLDTSYELNIDFAVSQWTHQNFTLISTIMNKLQMNIVILAAFRKLVAFHMTRKMTLRFKKVGDPEYSVVYL